MQTKDGRDYYRIRVRRGRNLPTLSKVWYCPDGWSQKRIDRELTKVAAAFEEECRTGEALSRSEKKALEEQRQKELESLPTFRSYAESVYLAQKEVETTGNTISSYRTALRVHIFPAIGDKKIAEVRPADLNRLLLDMQKQGLKHSTRVKTYNIINGIFKMAMLDDTIAVNPMDKVQRPKQIKGENAKEGPDSYTVEELKHIFAVMENEPLKWRVYVHLTATTGIRRGEACALRWDHIDWTKETILIDSSLNYTVETGDYFDTTKSGRNRELPVPGYVLRMLREWRQEQSSDCVSQYVFNKAGTPEAIQPQTPTQYLAKLSKRTGIPNLHPHALRHTFASISLTSGADVVSVSELLGHADSSTTLRVYAHASEESQKRASEIFQNAIKTNKSGQG